MEYPHKDYLRKALKTLKNHSQEFLEEQRKKVTDHINALEKFSKSDRGSIAKDLSRNISIIHLEDTTVSEEKLANDLKAARDYLKDIDEVIAAKKRL